MTFYHIPKLFSFALRMWLIQSLTVEAAGAFLGAGGWVGVRAAELAVAAEVGTGGGCGSSLDLGYPEPPGSGAGQRGLGARAAPGHGGEPGGRRTEVGPQLWAGTRTPSESWHPPIPRLGSCIRLGRPRKRRLAHADSGG